MTDLIYLYGFVPQHFAEVPRRLTGVQGAPVEVLPLDGINAVISPVDPGQFAQQHIEAHMQDLTWVAARGAEHEAVVAWCVDQGQILPAALFTLYSSRAVLQEVARDQEALIKGELARLKDLREWDLKVSYNAQQLTDHADRFSDAVREIEAEIAAATPGRKYLLERKRSEVSKTEVSRVARDQAAAILQALRPHAVDVVSLPLPSTREQLPVVLHAALLVARSAEPGLVTAFQERSEAYRDSGIEISFSGPWAPYRFVRRDRR